MLNVYDSVERAACIGPLWTDSNVCFPRLTAAITRFGSAVQTSDAKRLKALEDENAKLKKLLAEAELDKAMLKEIASKKW